MEFKASEIDTVVRELLECNKVILDLEFQEKHLPDWQILKVKAIFKYLIEHHHDMFDDAAYDPREQQYGLYIGSHKTKWEEEMQKGGFTAFWKKKEDLITNLRTALSDANIGASAITTTVELVRSIFYGRV